MSTRSSIFYLPFAFPGLDGIRCAFGTRIGGFGASPFDKANISFDVGDKTERVASNRRILRNMLGFGFWQELRQVHGTEMVFEPEPGLVEEMPAQTGDGLATSIPQQALVIKTADCQPVLLAHSSGKYVAGLHVGWRGNVAGFPMIGVRAFCEHYGLRPQDIMAVRGPSLGPGASQFVNFDDEFGPDFAAFFSSNTKCVNLWDLTRSQLIQAGLRPEHIFSLDFCTHSHPDLFFSYRRNRHTGRQASLIWISGK